MNEPKGATPTIHLAMAAVMKDIEAISKEKENKAQGFKFRGIDDVYNELHPIMAAHGITCSPFVKELRTQVIEKTVRNEQKYTFVTHVIMGYKFVGPDGSFDECSMPGEGHDNGDKSTAKALSVAHKYLLLEKFMIPTADIVDGDYYSPTIDPHARLEEIEEERRQLSIEQKKELIAELRKKSLDAATDEEKKRLQGQASDLQAQVDNAQVEAEQAAAASAAEPPKEKKSSWRKASFAHMNLPPKNSFYQKTLGDIFDSKEVPLKRAVALMTNLLKPGEPDKPDSGGYAWKVAKAKQEGKPVAAADEKLFLAIVDANEFLQARQAKEAEQAA